MRSLKRLAFYLKPYRNMFVVMFVLLLVIVTMTTTQPLLEGNITSLLLNNVTDIQNGVVGAHIDFEGVFRILSILFVIYLVGTSSRLLLQTLLSNAIQGAIFTIRQDVKEKMGRLPIAYFDKHSAGDLMSRISTDVEVVSAALQQSLYQVVYSSLMLVLAIIMMFTIDSQLAFIGLMIVPLSFFSSRIIVNISQKLFKRQQNSLAHLQAVVQEKLTGFNEILLYNYQENAMSDFDKANQELCENGFRANFISGLMAPSVVFFTYLAIGLAVFFGMIKIVEGTLLVGALQAFIRYIWQVSQPLTQMTQLSATIQSSFAAMDRIFDYLDEEEDVADKQTAQDIDMSSFAGNVSFNNISFGYGNKPVLKNVSVDIKAGELVAIVGPTGAGKTTLINLLMRFYDVDSGAICIDGVDIRDMKRDDLRSLFGLVLQDTWLFSGKIKDNIAYGKDGASEEDIINAAKQANVHHFITTLSDGYDMILNEESSNISNGEKQLLTIARVVLHDPKILILDEATSSIDTRLDAMIQEAMAKLSKGRTSFVIAHRLSTIRNADKILVMREGNIIEQGNHDSLMAQNGFYADLYNSQFDDDKESDL